MQNGIHTKDIFRIHSEKNRGMRKYMEDELRIVEESDNEPRTTFLGIFDGHGGGEAAVYAKQHLFENIKQQDGFYGSDVDTIKECIRQGFLKTHHDMFNILDTWPKRKDGHNSTSGTTATVVILREGKLFVAHVGDSAAVIAEKKNNQYVAQELTEDHKPESSKEKSRIERMGGRVAATNGIPRVIWKRPIKQLSSTPRYEYVPFLAVSRSLGDLWSFDASTKEFVVSPHPDIEYIDLVKNKHKFVLLASDGLWGVMNAKEAVDMVCQYELNQTSKKRNCSKYLIDESLSLWQRKRHRADNISVIVLFLDEEFNTWKDHKEDDDASVGSSEADTVILDWDDEDTPPMTESLPLNGLKRQIAFPYGGSNGVSSVGLSTTTDSSSEIENSSAKKEATLIESNSGKRKHENDHINSSPSFSAKKTRKSLSDGLELTHDEKNQRNMITKLSKESLNRLQLDDDKKTTESNESDDSTFTVIALNNLDNPLNYIPVPQVAK